MSREAVFATTNTKNQSALLRNRSMSTSIPEDAAENNTTSLRPLVDGNQRYYGMDGMESKSRGPPIEAADGDPGDYDIPDSHARLNELADVAPVKNPNEDQLYRRSTLEQERKAEQEFAKEKTEPHAAGTAADPQKHEVSKFATQLYTMSYLILFSILGTLARLGIQALTFYPGTPSVFPVLWANFGGSLFMGFLSEDRMLFKHEWGTATYDQQIKKSKERNRDEENGSPEPSVDLAAARKAHNSMKKTFPLYIGLATGFCGSFTSFSSFIRDVFFALSNKLPTPLDHPSDYNISTSTSSIVSRSGGYSFMALLAVIIITVSVSLGAFFAGAHLAIVTEPYTPALPFRLTRKVIDPVSVFVAWGCWLGALFLTIWPPDRNSGGLEIWRGRAVFAILFAPLGCLGRFFASIYLNGRIASFPLGTFSVNIFGTIILGTCYDLQHVPLGGVIGCQVLQGVEDGFCGCLTTVSTWVSELSSLRRSHAYRYGATSVVVATCFLVVIMGSLQWTDGFAALQCVTG